MITVRITDDGNVWPATPAEAKFTELGAQGTIQCRWDWKTFDAARTIAEGLTKTTGKQYIATDSGDGVYPRYDVIAVPEIGDDVSGYINGDSYIEGKIVAISESLRVITTSTGKRFYRRKLSGAWVHKKYYSLIQGHIEERNPHV